MDDSPVVVCSYFTADDYYRSHADAMRENLSRLGLAYELDEIEKGPEEDWADICRKKIGFLSRVCQENPDKRVFWIDVDCALLDLPEYIAGFTSDIIGFQRGFGSPLRIGYAHRTRFWEPCFFGINTTPGARKFVDDAKVLEQNADIKATDDYFFEESWRANAAQLSFQFIPSAAVLSKAAVNQQGVPAFFSFGASGNVARFKDSVVQHDHIGQAKSPMMRRARNQALRGAKLIERKLPDRASRHLRKAADSTGLTRVLTGNSTAVSGEGGSRHRNRIVNEMIMSGQRGELARIDEAFGRLTAVGIPTSQEVAAKRAADTFGWYASRNPDRDPLKLAWWPRPFPGNFGDWLSPLIFEAASGRSIVYQGLTAPSRDSHLMSVGSVGRFIKPSSIVVGTGISSADVKLDRDARYISVRGPLTAELVKKCGGPGVESLGDPGALISRVIPVERGLTNGRVALVRHFKHGNLPAALPDGMDEISVLLSHPGAIRSFVAELNQYDAVVTSAMHVMIICHSYGIPCALITFEGFESVVPGSGIKYRDYSLGVGLETAYEPVAVSSDLRRLNLESMLAKERIAEAKLDEIEQAVSAGIAAYLATNE